MNINLISGWRILTEKKTEHVNRRCSFILKKTRSLFEMKIVCHRWRATACRYCDWILIEILILLQVSFLRHNHMEYNESRLLRVNTTFYCYNGFILSRQMSTWKSNLILSRNSRFWLLNSKKNRISSKCLSEFIEQLKIVDWQRDHLSSLWESKHYYFNSNRMNFMDHWYALQWYRK